MTLDARMLSFVTNVGVLFLVPVSEVRATFTRFSTLIIEAAGSRYVFVTGAYASRVAPDFSDWMLAEIAVAQSQEQSTRMTRSLIAVGAGRAMGALAIGAAAVVASFAVRVGATVDLFRAQHAGYYLSRRWAEHLQEQGVQVEMRGTTFARSQLFLWSIFLPSFAAFVAIVYFIVWAASGAR